MASLTRLVAAALCLAVSPLAAQESVRTPVLQQVARPAAAQEQRVALVIGNNAYKDAPLTNPINDARAISDALRDSGFAVTLRTDITHRDFLVALREFGDALRKGGVGVFYFAGHGVQIKGRNYLVPVGATIEREDEVAYAAVDAQAVLDKMEAAGNTTNLVILDACRNNPFARSFRSSAQGLAQMDAPVGTLVAFATSPGSVASDGTGQNGLYTQHLLKAMRQPGMKVEDVFKQTRAAVRRESQGKQIPWESTSMEGDFYFFQPAPTPPLPSTTGGRPSATQESPLKLDDIEAEFQGRQQGAQKLAQMQRDFDRVLAFTTDPDFQQRAWERFLSAWSADIPDFTGDEALRDQARTRLQALRQRPSQIAAAGPGARPPVVVGSVATTPEAKPQQLVEKLQVGQLLTYRITDLYTRNSRLVKLRVSKIDGDSIEFDGGARKEGLAGELRGDSSPLLGALDSYQPPDGWWRALLNPGSSTKAEYRNLDGHEVSIAVAGAQRADRHTIGTASLATAVAELRGHADVGGLGSSMSRHSLIGTLHYATAIQRIVRIDLVVRGPMAASSFNRDIRERVELISIE